MKVPHIYVTEEVCSACPFYYKDKYSVEDVQKTVAALLRHHVVPECILVAVARFKSKPHQEGTTCCAAFYHLYGKHIYPIQAALEAGEISYFSTEDYESLEESGLLVYKDKEGFYHKGEDIIVPDDEHAFYERLDRIRAQED